MTAASLLSTIVEPFTADQLIYRGEGNSSLVVAIKSSCKVIRLLKSDAKKLKNSNDVLTHLMLHIDFNRKVLPDVVPSSFYHMPQLICLDEKQLDLIKNFVKDKRPTFRLDKIITNCRYALLMSDYCTIPWSISVMDMFANHYWPVLAIEIKPKQGFLPVVDLFQNEDLLRIKSKICRFGLSQFHKLQKQSINLVSSYCPLDLFSGCSTITTGALKALIENPQNNFRVFYDTHLVYGEDMIKNENKRYLSIDNLCDVLDQFFNHRKSFLNNVWSNSSNNNHHYQSNINHLDGDYGVDRCDDDASTSGILINTFCDLLVKALFAPVMTDLNQNISNHQDEVSDRFSMYEKSEKNTTILREFKKFNFDSNKYLFFQTFIKMFDSELNSINFHNGQCDSMNNAMNNNETVINSNDLNNNNDNQMVESDLFSINHNGNIGGVLFSAPILHHNTNNKTNENSKHSNHRNFFFSRYFDISNSISNGSNNKTGFDSFVVNSTYHHRRRHHHHPHRQTCLLHQSKFSAEKNGIPNNNHQNNNDNDVHNHKPPKGSVLDAILEAQKLDSIDSLIAVDLFQKLSTKYQEFKQNSFFSTSFSLNDAEPPDFFQKFIMQNLDDLDKLWRFLISLTAKDCSIMIALQRVNNNQKNSQTTSSKNRTSESIVITANGGEQYQARVTITDLDYKPACKIQRMLHNDRRMIQAFYKALNNSSSNNNNDNSTQSPPTTMSSNNANNNNNYNRLSLLNMTNMLSMNDVMINSNDIILDDDNQ